MITRGAGSIAVSALAAPLTPVWAVNAPLRVRRACAPGFALENKIANRGAQLAIPVPNNPVRQATATNLELVVVSSVALPDLS
jgi:hypothetical protein